MNSDDYYFAELGEELKKNILAAWDIRLRLKGVEERLHKLHKILPGPVARESRQLESRYHLLLAAVGERLYDVRRNAIVSARDILIDIGLEDNETIRNKILSRPMPESQKGDGDIHTEGGVTFASLESNMNSLAQDLVRFLLKQFPDAKEKIKSTHSSLREAEDDLLKSLQLFEKEVPVWLTSSRLKADSPKGLYFGIAAPDTFYKLLLTSVKESGSDSGFVTAFDATLKRIRGARVHVARLRAEVEATLKEALEHDDHETIVDCTKSQLQSLALDLHVIKPQFEAVDKLYDLAKDELAEIAAYLEKEPREGKIDLEESDLKEKIENTDGLLKQLQDGLDEFQKVRYGP